MSSRNLYLALAGSTGVKVLPDLLSTTAHVGDVVGVQSIDGAGNVFLNFAAPASGGGGGSYLPLTGGAITGNLSISGTLTMPGTSQSTFGPSGAANFGARWFRSATDRNILYLKRDSSTTADGPLFETNYVTTHTGGSGPQFNAYFGTSMFTDANEVWGLTSVFHTKATNASHAGVSIYGQAVRDSVPSGIGVPLEAGVFEVRSLTGKASSIDGMLRSIELDMTANDVDDYVDVGTGRVGARVALAVVLARQGSGADAQFAGGLSITGDPAHVSVGQAVAVRMPFYESVLDTRDATEMAGAHAIWLRTGHDIALDTAGTAGAANLVLSSDGTVATLTGPLTLSGSLGVWGSAGAGAKPTVTGSRGGNAALASLLTALASYGLVTDSTSA